MGVADVYLAVGGKERGNYVKPQNVLFAPDPASPDALPPPSPRNLPERRKRYTSRVVEEEEGTQRRPCGNEEEMITHTVGECELCKEERYVLEVCFGSPY